MVTGAQAISAVAAKERVGLWAPVSIAQYSVYEALAAELMPSGCLSMSLDAPTVAVLNDKNKFSQWAAAKGLRVPKCFSVTSKAQLLEYNSRCTHVLRRLKQVHATWLFLGCQ